VLSDNFKGMYAATEYVIASGRRRIALMRFGPDGGVSDLDRNRGFLAALQDYGLGDRPVEEVPLGLASHKKRSTGSGVQMVPSSGRKEVWARRRNG